MACGTTRCDVAVNRSVGLGRMRRLNCCRKVHCLLLSTVSITLRPLASHRALACNDKYFRNFAVLRLSCILTVTRTTRCTSSYSTYSTDWLGFLPCTVASSMSFVTVLDAPEHPLTRVTISSLQGQKSYYARSSYLSRCVTLSSCEQPTSLLHCYIDTEC